ncbi:hypothetical protein RUMHYD_01126 [Blautia hydrogenotrophica DSM 10507]|uniref:Uncharacterized protein n=1 Tax=Blautia hydrogenotrophica (strain DSM 10507 / JCM 14656 / S5a33) TaxID=476272 RepID=C0CJV6_BLAHS|nr:hypothetical protein RUMHYD_01126 [Blautia hydrogenotrophica DSM 10507]
MSQSIKDRISKESRTVSGSARKCQDAGCAVFLCYEKIGVL